MPNRLPATLDARPPPGAAPAVPGGAPHAVPVQVPVTAPAPALVPAPGAAEWSPAASLLAQLEAGDGQRLPRVDELPVGVRRQLAQVLASRMLAIREAVGMPPGAAVRLQAGDQGRIAVAVDHPAAARLQAGLEADVLAVALVRYLHAAEDAGAGPTPARDAASGRVLPYVRGDELGTDVDPSRIPGHPHGDAGRPSPVVDGMRGIAWAVGVAIAALVLASLL